MAAAILPSWFDGRAAIFLTLGRPNLKLHWLLLQHRVLPGRQYHQVLSLGLVIGTLSAQRPWDLCCVQNSRNREKDLTCNRCSVGQSKGLSIPRSSVRFRLKPDNSNSYGFELHRPLNKGTKLLLKVLKAIIIKRGETGKLWRRRSRGEKEKARGTGRGPEERRTIWESYVVGLQ